MYKGFEPVVDKDCSILILGSFPSVISRKNEFYYGNKRNRFWRMLEAAFDEKIEDSIESKKKCLLKHNIALWDILQYCDIEGSSDSDIKEHNSKPVNLIGFLEEYPNIEMIICNGKKSFELAKKYFPELDIEVKCLPSTSPANTRFDMNEWLEALNKKRK